MPRPLRIAPAGSIFHITSRGNRRQEVFLDDDDRRWFLRLFETAVMRFGWTCHAYCLMDNHVHLLIEIRDENLSEGLQWLLGRYGQDFNWRHGFDGHVFQGRFKSEIVTRDRHLLELSRYIVLNPVRAGICARAADWPWSSYRAAMGVVATPRFLTVEWLLEQFGRTTESARLMFELFVADGAARASPWRRGPSDHVRGLTPDRGVRDMPPAQTKP